MRAVLYVAWCIDTLLMLASVLSLVYVLLVVLAVPLGLKLPLP
jgi:hypothetical protein